VKSTINSRYRTRIGKLDDYAKEKQSKSKAQQCEIDLTLLTDAELDLIAESWRIQTKGERMLDSMRVALDDITLRSARPVR